MVMNPFFITAMTILIISVYLTSHRHHLLMLLLFFEAGALTSCILTGLLIKSFLTFSFMVILCFGAAEASMGLSLLVLMARNFGNDMIKSLSMNKT